MAGIYCALARIAPARNFHAMPPTHATRTSALVAGTYRALSPADLYARMRQPRVIDPNHFLANTLGQGLHVTYVATGKAAI